MQDALGEPLAEQPDEPSRELTVDEAIDLAILLQKQEDFAAAEIVYREIRRVDPANAKALHYSGVLAHQLGRSADGIELIQRSLAVAPDCADWHNNLGIALQEAARLEEAIEAYRRAIALDPSHARAHSNLGVLLRATGKPAEAEAAYRRAIELDPKCLDAYTNLGILLNSQQRTTEAVACFCRVITLRPKHPEARKLLGVAHCTLGEFEEAARIFREWLESEPGDPIATHMLAACTGHDAPPRASDTFVERTFDSFAASFESKLARLSYRAPKLIAAVLEQLAGTPARQFDVIDVGCGTGLCGPLIAPYARTLVGVDLSARMLAQAREKHVYDELLQMELTAALRGRSPASADVIVSADTLVYFGDLSDVADAVAQTLRPGGSFIFTLERATAASVREFRLEVHGRYTHAQDYVERLLRDHGMQAEIGYADLRTESGMPVAGLVVRARRMGRESGDGADDATDGVE
jgi:predicted TPR repeat methyltransferase